MRRLLEVQRCAESGAAVTEQPEHCKAVLCPPRQALGICATVAMQYYDYYDYYYYHCYYYYYYDYYSCYSCYYYYYSCYYYYYYHHHLPSSFLRLRLRLRRRLLQLLLLVQQVLSTSGTTRSTISICKLRVDYEYQPYLSSPTKYWNQCRPEY